MKVLHNYQHQALTLLQQRVEQGNTRLYISLPTGTGKSMILVRFASQRITQGRVLVLTHRQDLALQLAQALAEEGLETGVLM